MPLREERLGVRLTPLKARILDTIKRAGDTGIHSDDLYGIAFQDRQQRSMETLKSHIHQINDLLVLTDWRVRQIDKKYRLVRE